MSNLSRRLIILQGSNEAIIKQLVYLNQQVSGDWIVMADHWHQDPYYSPKQAKLLLGREFKHAIFDARQGFNLEAFAILAGTLVAGSLLILILPEHFCDWRDEDSLRWSELPSAILVPNFVTHLRHVMTLQQRYSDHFYYLSINEQYDANYLFNLLDTHEQINDNQKVLLGYQEQQALLHQIVGLDAKIILLTAKRGRGKSALAGFFAQHHHCWITAPNKNSVTTLMKFAPENTQFFAPDELIMQITNSVAKLVTEPVSKPDWLIIDEAAMIPLPMISALIKGFQHILLTSTTDGYEGTGQGLLLKLLNQYPQDEVIYCQLNMPIRWMANDALEYFIDNLIVANSLDINTEPVTSKPLINRLQQNELVQSPSKLAAFFGLLKSAHYRTTLIDLRRLLDADNLLLYSAELNEQNIVGVLVAIKEGGLNEALALQILQGYRRPKGNLVAQSLVAHAGELDAAKLRSLRVNRIAVSAPLRRKGIANSLLTELIDQAKVQQFDFVSTSFAYSAEMYQFWQQCGFQVVHVGTHKDASSGSYAVMAIYPLTPAGLNLCHTMQGKLARNWYWLQHIVDINLPINIDEIQLLDEDDKVKLNLFATTSFAYSTSFAVLYRLANWAKSQSILLLKQLPILSRLVDTHFNDKQVIVMLELSSKNELLTLLRQEVYQFIQTQGFINE